MSQLKDFLFKLFELRQILAKSSTNKAQTIQEINSLEQQIDGPIHSFLQEFKKHSQWQRNQASISCLNQLDKTLYLSFHKYNGDIGCCFSNQHKNLLKVECLPVFDLKPQHFTFDIHTNKFIIHEIYLPMLQAYLLLHQTCKFVHNIALVSQDKNDIEKLFKQLISANQLLTKMNSQNLLRD